MKRFTHIPPKTELPEIIVDPNSLGVRYYITPENNRYPSITSVLGIKSNPAIDNWRKMLGKKAAKRETDRCSERGNAVHDMAEQYLKNNEAYSANYSFKFVKEFNQLRFLLDNIDNIIVQEQALYSDNLRIAGRVDCIGEYDGKRSIIDFKTSTTNKSPDMIQNYFTQCTAYALMWNELMEDSIDNIVILMSVERGIMPLKFETTIYDHIPILIKDINNFYKQRD